MLAKWLLEGPKLALNVLTSINEGVLREISNNNQALCRDELHRQYNNASSHW